MNSYEKIILENLQNKITQHEQTIAQLVRIVASMNKRVSELKIEQYEDSPKQLLMK